MELDPSVVGGVIAGVVGISLGIGASIWAEKRVVVRANMRVSIMNLPVIYMKARVGLLRWDVC
jgi:hypothetical protein